jgi:predicted metal-dependent peptidase
VRTTRHKESNRFPGEPGIRIKRLQKLVVAVDTSGSIGEKELGEFLAEINGMARAGAEIKLIECDCKIHTVTPFRRNELPKFKGGGGTDFDPVMQWLRDNRHERFGGCIYLTDGCAPTPTIDPRCPVLWVITPEMDVKQGWNFGGIA